VAASSSNPYSATLTVTAPAQSASLRTPSNYGPFLWWPGGLALGGVFLPGWRKRKAGLLGGVVLGVIVLVSGLLLVGCGGGKSSSSSSATSTSSTSTTLTGSVTVQAVSGSLSHTVSVPVTVN
jgi:hypothetical protein